jgi:hypothetical protein
MHNVFRLFRRIAFLFILYLYLKFPIAYKIIQERRKRNERRKKKCSGEQYCVSFSLQNGKECFVSSMEGIEALLRMKRISSPILGLSRKNLGNT